MRLWACQKAAAQADLLERQSLQGQRGSSPHQGIGILLQAQAGTLKANAEELRQKISEAHATLDDKRHTVSVLDERYQA